MKKKTPARLLAIIVTAFFLTTIYSSIAVAKIIKWRMVSTWPASFPLANIDKRFVKAVNEMSGGRFEIKLFSAGEAIPGLEVFDAVRSGSFQLSGEGPLYWGGKDPVFNVIGSSTMLLNWIDYWVWLYQGGGIDLLQKAYDKHGMVWFPMAMVPCESGFRTNKPIESLKDFKGLKIRASGKYQGEILRRLGASHVMLSGSELYQSLEKGTIDGTEFAAPGIDWAVGLGEVTKYWLTPAGWHQTGTPIGLMINKKAWSELPDDLKKIIEYAVMADFNMSTTEMEYQSFSATRKFIEKGVKVCRLSQEDLDKLQVMYNDILIEGAKENPAVAEILKSWFKFLKEGEKWKEVVAPFGYGRNIKNMPDVNVLK